MSTKYPPSTRVSVGRLAVGSRILIRDRQSDQPIGGSSQPFASGIWTVTATTSRMDHRGRRAQRTYAVTVEHPGAGVRTFHSSPVQRVNLVSADA